ncbi:hypothetical protein Tco_1155458 [Tanacetum coccineum]
MYYPRFTKVIIHYFLTQDKTLSWRNKIGMHTSKDDYLINTLRFVSVKEATQIYGATPPKKARKFKKPVSPKLTTVPVSTEEPTGKLKRVKRPAKKSTQAPARGVVIRETPEMPLSKKKENVDVARGVPDVTEKESFESKVESWGNDEYDSNNDQDSSCEDSNQENASDDDKTQSDNDNEFDSKHEKDENESDSKSDQEENEEDDEEEEEEEVVKTPSNDSDDEDEANISDKAKGDGDEEIDYTTSHLYDDVDIRLNELVDTDKGFIQEEVISETSPIYSTIIPQSLPSFTLPPPQSTLTPPPTTEAINPPSTLLNLALVFQLDNRVTALEKEVPELKRNDPLNTQVTALVDEYLNARLRVTREEFMNRLSSSITARITEQVKIQLPQILPQEVPNFAPIEIQCMLKKILIDKMDKSESYLAAPEHRECYEGFKKSYDLDNTFFSTYDKVYLLNRSRKDKDEDPSDGSDRGKSVQLEEPEFKVADSDMPQDQEENPGPAFRLLKDTRSYYAELEYDFEECYKALSEKLDWENLEGGDYPFDLTKPLPLVMSGNRQKVPVDYFFNNDLKYLQGGVSTMTYTTSITKTKAAQYDLPSIEDMVPNIWVHVKVAYDKHALWGISHWREQRKTFYGYTRGLQSRHDVYSTKRILAVTQVKVIRKHGYGYLKEIVVRRADNDLYRFKEGDFPRLCINDIEDMLLHVVQNRLPASGKRDPYTPYQGPQGFIYVDNNGRNRLMRSYELYKFSDRTLTGLRTSLDDIIKNI